MKCQNCEKPLNKSYLFCPYCSQEIESNLWTSSYIVNSFLTNYFITLKGYIIIFKLLITQPEKVINGYINRKIFFNPHYFLLISLGIALFISQSYTIFKKPEYLYFNFEKLIGINLYALPIAIAISIRLFFFKDNFKAIPYHIYCFILYMFSIALLEMSLFGIINDIFKNRFSIYYNIWSSDTNSKIFIGLSIPMIIYFYYGIYRWIKMNWWKKILFFIFSFFTSFLLFNTIMSVRIAYEYYYDEGISECWGNLIFDACFSKDYWYVYFKAFDYAFGKDLINNIFIFDIKLY